MFICAVKYSSQCFRRKLTCPALGNLGLGPLLLRNRDQIRNTEDLRRVLLQGRSWEGDEACMEQYSLPTDTNRTTQLTQ